MIKLMRTLAVVSMLGSVSYVAQADDTMKAPKGERTMDQVYFDFDSANVEGDLLTVANQLECTPKETIILDAYADPVGTNAYNADLAQRRAEAVKEKLVDMGIKGDRIMLGIFGERGERRSTHDQDRRVEIRTSDEPVAALEDRRDGTAVAVVEPGGTPEEHPQVGKR